MKKLITILLAVCMLAALAVPAAAATEQTLESTYASMQPALIVLFVILGVLAVSSIVFTVVLLVGRKAKDGTPKKRNTAQIVLLVILYVATVLVLVCSLLCLNRYNQVAQALAENTPSTSESTSETTTEATTEETTEVTTEETTEATQPDPTLAPAMTDDSDPANWNVNWQLQSGGSTVSSYTSADSISFGSGEDYFALPGIGSFRGNNYRTGASYGTAKITEETLTKLWGRDVGSLNGWPGIGWTGQPLVVQWDDETKAIMNLYEEKKAKEGLVEVIATTLDGNIYFYDLEDGSYTRDPLWIGMGFKGTASLDPRGYPVLYAGSGLTNGGKSPRMYIISLIDGSILMENGGGDSFAYRGWYAFDSSPMISADTDTLIWPGESGVLYTIKLNTSYDKAAGTLTMDPETVVKTRYSTSLDRTVGYEASSIIVENYLYLGDNGGMFYCIDLNTMQLVWTQNVRDDVNATPVFQWGDDGIGYIYLGTSMEYAGGTSYIYKINANNGQIVWEKSYSGIVYDKDVSGGILSSPVLGKEGTDLEGLVIFSISKAPQAWQGILVALDTGTGEVVWEKTLDYYTWSSAVDVYTEDGKGYIVLGDSVGTLFLMDGATGNVLDSIVLGSNMEASPVVFNDTLVIGTRGCQVFGIKLK